MKKLIAILLISLLSITLLGYHLVFGFQLASVKSAMKAALQKQAQHEDVVLISLSKEDSKQFFWEDENEFRYKGEMYDVIEKKTEGGQIIIRCISDKKETSLLNEYQKNNKRSSTGSTIVQLITSHFVLPVDHCFNRPQKIIKTPFKEYSSSLQELASAVVLPPPDVC